MKTRVLVLGAGFGGLELSTQLSEALGAAVEITLIDHNDSFMFGYSKLDVMFGKTTAAEARLPYSEFIKPGVTFRKENVTAIDPAARKVTTNLGTYDADVLVVALGANYDLDATPGLAQGGNEFYSVAGAERLRDILPTFKKGKIVIGVCAAPFKCPPAPSECALLLHDFLTERGVRKDCEISIIIPFGTPVPPSPETSAALVTAFKEREITFIASRRVQALDPTRHRVVLDDGSEVPYDLFMGVPKHRVPEVVVDSGMSENGWIPVNPKTLETRFPNVYAVGDGANTGTPKAGVFAEGAARAVADSLIARIQGNGEAGLYSGKGSCYIEFGAGRIGRVDVDFSGPSPTGTFHTPSEELRSQKNYFGSSRRVRWFNRQA